MTKLGLCAIVFAITASSAAAIRPQAGQGVKVIKQVAPVYPEEAKRARVEGNVVLEVTIEENGEVSMTKVVSGHKLLQQAAVDAVKQWRFVNDANASVTIQLTLAFALKPDSAEIKKDLTNTHKVERSVPGGGQARGNSGRGASRNHSKRKGEVIEAQAVGGNEKLRQAAVDAAKQFRFSNGLGKTVVATITFNFVLDK